MIRPHVVPLISLFILCSQATFPSSSMLSYLNRMLYNNHTYELVCSDCPNRLTNQSVLINANESINPFIMHTQMLIAMPIILCENGSRAKLLRARTSL